MMIEPGPRLGMLMGSIIVEDHMNQKADEFLVRVTLHAATADLAIEHVEGSDQGCGAVSLIVMRHRAGAAPLQRQSGLGAAESLDLALLVDLEPIHNLAESGGIGCASFSGTAPGSQDSPQGRLPLA